MAEAIISRRGGNIDSGIKPPPIIADRASVIVYVTDSNNAPIQNLSVHCKDGSYWYNYHTNEKGQCLFMGNSGHMNITAHNYSIQQNIRYIDQGKVDFNLDAPVGTSNVVNLSLKSLPTSSFTAMTTNVQDTSNLFSGSCYVRCADHANIFLGGAGGGGSLTDPGWSVTSTGGGGGGITIANNILMNKNSAYLFYIGSGGANGRVNTASGNRGQHFPGDAGGSTSAFGYSATGGGGGRFGWMIGDSGTGTYRGGNGGGKLISGAIVNAENSEYSNWGGGGGAYSATAGTPGGGKGGDRGGFGSSGVNGGGGGGGGGWWSTGSDRNIYFGGSGGPGKITFTFY